MTEVATISDHHEPGEERRRDFLCLSAGAMAAVGAGAALWPLIASMHPAAEILALSSIEVDSGPIEPGQRVTVQWRGQPVFIDRRTPGQVAAARADDDAVLPDPELGTAGVLRPEGLVVIGICAHFRGVPLEQERAIRRGNGTAGFAP